MNSLHEFSSEIPRAGPHLLLSGARSGNSRGWRIDYRLLLDALGPLVESQGKGLGDGLNVKEIAAFHKSDRDCLAKRVQAESGEGATTPCIDGVIGKRLSEVFVHASLSVSIAGNEHFVPTIVMKCIEELYRTGLYQSQLFRKTPNFVRVEELIVVYDNRELPETVRIARRRPQHHLQSTSDIYFGAQTSLHMESTENICALLRTFLQNIPEPILPPSLFELTWNCCGVRQEVFHLNSHLPSSHGRIPLNRLGSGISPEELVRIYAAQIILHLLPTPNFSLIVYLLSFFSQVVMVHEENGLAIDDVASMFGAIIFGGATERIVSWKDSKPRPRGEIMMRWFLRRWRQIYHGLFPFDDEGRPASSGVNVLSPSREVGEEDVTAARPRSGYFGLRDPMTVSAHDATASIATRLDGSEASPATSNMGSSKRKKVSALTPDPDPDPPGLVNPNGSSEQASNYLEEIWPHLTSDLRMKLNERLMDVMLEPIVSGSTMSRQRSHSVPAKVQPLPILHTPAHNDTATQRQLVLSSQRISRLERQAFENQKIMHDMLDENQRLRQDKTKLELRVKGLESELNLRDVRHKEGEEKARKDLQETVQGMARERDQARGIVSEIQRLSGMVGGGHAGASLARN